MANTRDINVERAMEAVLGWWREAGVDHVYADEASGFFAEQSEVPHEPERAVELPKAAKAEPKPTGPVLPAPEEWPATLVDFADWWLNEPALCQGTQGRVAPRGSAQPALMVLVAQPERKDRDTLLSGPDGALLDAFLRAAGLADSEVYRASLLPRHDPAPDRPALQPLAAVAWRHVALASPKRLLVLGENARSILQHDPAQRDFGLRGLNQEGVEVPILSGTGLAAMRKAPRTKRKLWQDWLDWTGH